jgi:hypothetical protein
MTIERLTQRDRLLALRRSALAQLAHGNQIDGGMLQLAADVDDALAALDAEAAAAIAPELAGRATVLDDNATITLELLRYSALIDAPRLRCCRRSPLFGWPRN